MELYEGTSYLILLLQLVVTTGASSQNSTTTTDDDKNQRIFVTFTNNQIGIMIGVVLIIYLIGHFLILMSASGFRLVDKTQTPFKVIKATPRGTRHISKLSKYKVKKRE